MKKHYKLLIIGLFISMNPFLMSCALDGDSSAKKSGVLLNLSKIQKVDNPPFKNFSCRTYCSQDKLRTGVAQLSWSAGKKSVLGKQSLQATIYKNGFKNRSFLLFELDAINLQTREKEKQPMVPPIVSVKGMKELRSSKVFLTKYSRKVTVKGLKNNMVDNGEGSLALIENLEPGLVYRFRLISETDKGWVTGEDVTCNAPVCPADMKGVE